MKKCRADDMRVGDSVHPLELADSAEAMKLARDALAGCGIEAGCIAKHHLGSCHFAQNGSGFAES